MTQLTLVSSSKCFDGFQNVFNHFSEELQCKMNFTIYQPPQASETHKVPVVYFLSGITSTEQNFITKTGFQRYASQLGICVVGPDTSPRGCGIEGEEDSWDLGTGCGFYVDATTEKWAKHYRMHSYVTKELIKLVENNFPYVQKNNRAISGHSMGGHGALICALKNPGLYKVATAFAPVTNPVNTKVGKKNFSAYLGENIEAWKEYDSTHLVAKYSGPPLHIIVDQGTEDIVMKEGELEPQALVEACEKAKFPLKYRPQEGYDHGYFFVGTFIEDHLKHIANILKQ